jgi:hypothetical protein
MQTDYGSKSASLNLALQLISTDHPTNLFVLSSVENLSLLHSYIFDYNKAGKEGESYDCLKHLPSIEVKDRVRIERHLFAS